MSLQPMGLLRQGHVQGVTGDGLSLTGTEQHQKSTCPILITSPITEMGSKKKKKRGGQNDNDKPSNSCYHFSEDQWARTTQVTNKGSRPTLGPWFSHQLCQAGS